VNYHESRKKWLFFSFSFENRIMGHKYFLETKITELRFPKEKPPFEIDLRDFS
jgi:hypothetical protein